MAISYSVKDLLDIGLTVKDTKLNPDIWGCLKALRLTRVRPTRRGCKKGVVECKQTVTEQNTKSDGVLDLYQPPKGRRVRQSSHRTRGGPAAGPGETILSNSIHTSNTSDDSNMQETRLLLANVRGLRTNIGALSHRACRWKADIIIATESLLNSSVPDSYISITGYQEPPLRRDRSDGWGGVSIWIRDGIQAQRHEDLEPADQELIWCSVQTQSGVLLLGAAYRPGSLPGSNCTLFNYLSEHLDNIVQSTKAQRVLILGDFNVHHKEWLNSHSQTDQAGVACKTFCLAHGLEQIVTKETRQNNILDLVLVDSPAQFTASVKAHVGTSDHCSVEVVFKKPVTTDRPYKRRLWDYKRANWGSMKQHLTDIDWYPILHCESPEQAVHNISKAIKTAMDTFIPHRDVKIKPTEVPWYTEACRLADNQVISCHDEWKSNPNTETESALNSAKQKYQSVEKEAKKQHFLRTREKLTSSDTKPKDWWWAVKRLQGSDGHASIPTLQDSNGTYSTTRDKAAVFCDLFAKKCTIEDANDAAPTVQSSTTETLTKMVFRPRDIKRVLKRLDPSKATGPDGIGNRVLRECASCLATALTKLFRYSFSRGYFPAAWKLASVVPVHKKKLRSNPENYRPISLLCNISKVMEFFVNKELRKHLFSNGLINSNQFGFRPKHSAPDLLTFVSHQWMSCLNNRQEAKVIALDIKAAFDRVWHKGLIAKLEARGVKGNLLKWISSYLCDRRIQVVVGGQTSEQRPINASVPQGSLLGPTLFLTYIDDLSDQIYNSMFLYADDSTLYCTVIRDGVVQAVESLNADLAEIHAWGQTWKVLFAPEKCKVMTISRKEPQPQPPLLLGGTVLQESDELDILGVCFPKNLSFQSHLDKVVSKAGQRVNMLRKIASHLDSKGKASVYKAHIRSTMEYAPLCWMSASETQLRRLDDIQHRAQRIIGPQVHLEPLAHRRLISALGLLYRMHKADQPEVLRSLLPPKVQVARSTRSTNASHALQPLAGRTGSGQWSLHQYDKSFLPAAIPVWNSLPSDVIGSPQTDDTKTFCMRAHRYLSHH